MARLAPVLPLLLFASGSAASGLALRHDVAEAEFLELGERFPAVVQVGGLGTGTLVRPDWVLTAAHVPEMLARMAPDRPLTVSFGEEDREVARVVYPPSRAKDRKRHDIALLQLDAPAPEGVDPLAVWAEKPETDAEFVVAGWGILASADEGVKPSPSAMAAKTRRRRAGWNVFDEYDEKAAVLTADLDAPDEGLALEAGPCIGDSGGPALVRVEGEGDEPDRWFVAAVVAHIDDTDEDGVVGEYGDRFGMTAVRGYLDWVRETLDD